MTEILYYPLIDCDAEGSEKAAMIPTPREDTVRAQAGMWLEEMIPHYFRLCSQNSNCPADTFRIRCPRCGTVLSRSVRTSTKPGAACMYVAPVT